MLAFSRESSPEWSTANKLFLSILPTSIYISTTVTSLQDIDLHPLLEWPATAHEYQHTPHCTCSPVRL